MPALEIAIPVMPVGVAEAAAIFRPVMEAPDRETILVIDHARAIEDRVRAEISDAHESRAPMQRHEFALFIDDPGSRGMPAAAARIAHAMCRTGGQVAS